MLEAHGLKSFDYRLLHALLCQLSGRPLSAELRAFLTVDETLVDLADDLFDYEEDVAKNTFNVYRCYLRAHPPTDPGAAGAALAELIARAVGPASGGLDCTRHLE